MTFKVTALLLFILVVGSPASARAAATGEIEWQNNYEAALSLAQQSGKPVLIDFAADWCGPCKEMARTFWPKPQIIELSQKFVCVSLNFDKNRDEVSRFKIDRIPAVVFTDPWGNVLANRFGYGASAVEALPQIMKVIPSDFSAISEWNTMLQGDKNNATALVKLGDFYREHELLDMSNAYYKRALKTKELAADAKEREDILLAVGISCLKQRDYEEARKTFEKCMKEVPNGARGDTALYGMLTAQLNLKKIGDAEKTLALLKFNYPNSSAIQPAEEKLSRSKNQKQ